MNGYFFEQAVSLGDLDAVEDLLSLEDADSNYRNDMDDSLLELAVIGRRSEIVDILLAHDADPNPNSREIQGNDDELLKPNPLTVAVKNKDDDICELLLKKGANVNDYSGNSEITALYEVCANNKYRRNINKILNSSDANVNACMTDSACLTPLHFAAVANNSDMVKILLKHGANQNMKTFKNQQTALELAIFSGSLNVYDDLLPITSVVNLDDIFMYFHERKDVNQVSQLLKSSLDPYDHFDQGDFTLSHNESDFNHNKVTNALIKFRAHVNTVFATSELTPLHYASSRGFPKVIKTMIKVGNANVNICDKCGFTPLFYASHYARIDAINILLTSGARVNDLDKHYVTPLYYACRNGHVEIVKILMKFGAHVNNNSPKEKSTPLHYACQSGRINVVKTLLEHKSIIKSPTNNRGETPLHIACLFGYTNMIKILIEHGSATNTLNNLRKTPLHIACCNGDANVVKTLLNHGALVNNVDKDGHMPLHDACSYGCSDVIKILLLNGADLTFNNFLPKLIANQYIKREIKVLIQEFASLRTNITPLNVLVKNEIRNRIIEHSQGVYFREKINQLPLPTPIKIDILTLFDT
ncbi:MAG: ankyrin repeat domain-containing protein [Endozoicomonadaceae bacterium]|nr:ankyrin repeat domain-containing protein [Endozoicomonadaceae bacterium]